MRWLARGVYPLALIALSGVQPAVAQDGSSGGMIEVEPGVQIRYVEKRPKSSKRTVLFIPGWGFAAEVWESQMRALEKTAHVVAIDPRSQGHSTKTTHGNTPEVRARDIERVIAHLNLRNVVLVGWSQGVQDVATYAAQSGVERIAGFVLVDAAVSSGPAYIVQDPQAAQQLLGRLAIYSAHQEPYLHGMMKAIFGKPLDRATEDRYVAMGMQTPTSIGVAMLVADMLTTDRRPHLRSLGRPTLIVASAASGELEAQRAMAQEIPNARIVEITDAGHGVFIDQPEKFNAELVQFINQR